MDDNHAILIFSKKELHPHGRISRKKILFSAPNILKNNLFF